MMKSFQKGKAAKVASFMTESYFYLMHKIASFYLFYLSCLVFPASRIKICKYREADYETYLSLSNAKHKPT